MVVDLVEERDDGIDGPVALEDVGVQHVDAELAVAGDVVRVVGRGLVLLVLHEEEVAVQRVEGVAEEEGHQAVGPRVRPEDVEDAQARAAQSDGGEELELEAGKRRKG